MRVMVVDDEPQVLVMVRRALVRDGWAVDTAENAADGLWLAESHDYDALVLDLTLPDRDGLDVLTTLRKREDWTPVLLLTGRASVDDRVTGLDAGADDYLAKPFSVAELRARVRALARRRPVDKPTVLEVGDLSLDMGTLRARRGDQDVDLTAKEAALLSELMREPGRVLSREQLIERAWDFAGSPGSNVVDVHVRAIRDKVDRPFDRHSIQTVRGAGYRIVDDR